MMMEFMNQFVASTIRRGVKKYEGISTSIPKRKEKTRTM